MFRKSTIILAAVALMGSIPATTAFAGTTVARCDFKERGNLFVPGVRVCSPTKITDIKVGEKGLTREIFFNDKALMEYAKERFDLSPLDVAGGVCNRCDAGEDGKDEPQETRADPPYDPPEEPTDGPTNDRTQTQDKTQDQNG